MNPKRNSLIFVSFISFYCFWADFLTFDGLFKDCLELNHKKWWGFFRGFISFCRDFLFACFFSSR